MSVLESYDPRASFWIVHPQFKSLGIFKNMYESDPSNKRWDSSKKMWAIAFLVDNSKFNKFKNFPEEDRKKLIEEGIMGDKKFKWGSLQKYIELYEDSELSTLRRSLRILNIKVEDRNNFLSTITYTVENAKEIDSIIANTDKIFDLILKLEKQIEKEESEQSGAVRGGRQESLSEQKTI